MRIVSFRRGCDPPPASLLALAPVLFVLLAGTEAPESRPAATTRPFAPGVEIDWARREVRVDAKVVLQRGALEFLICFPGKEHESVARFQASAEHIFQALGLIGLTPSRTTTQPGEPMAGDLVEIEFEWRDGESVRRAPAREWIREAEYARPPIALHFVFLGSAALADRTLMAGRTGEGVALVDFPQALIGVTRHASSHSGELWVEAHVDRVPPVETPVTVIFRAAQPFELTARIDFRGVIHVNGVPATVADLADLVLVHRRMAGAQPVRVAVNDALSADVARIRAELTKRGVPEEALSFRK